MNEEKQHRLVSIAVIIDLICLLGLVLSAIWFTGHSPEPPQPGPTVYFFVVLFLVSLSGIFISGGMALIAILAHPRANLISFTAIGPVALAGFFILAGVWAVFFARCN